MVYERKVYLMRVCSLDTGENRYLGSTRYAKGPLHLEHGKLLPADAAHKLA